MIDTGPVDVREEEGHDPAPGRRASGPDGDRVTDGDDGDRVTDGDGGDRVADPNEGADPVGHRPGSGAADGERDTDRRGTNATDGANDGSQPDDHLADVADGCGCAEVWEHLSERREAERRQGGPDDTEGS